MQHTRRDEVIRVRVDPLEEPKARPFHDLAVLRHVDPPGVELDREDLLRLARWTTNLLPPLEKVRLAELDGFDELGEEDGEAEGDGLEGPSEVGDVEEGRAVEDVLALDLDELLDLRHAVQRRGGDLGEGDRERVRVVDVDRDGEGLQRDVDLVAEEERDAPEVAVELGLDPDLELAIFVQDSLKT